MEMNILAGVLGGVAAVSLTANWLQSKVIEQYLVLMHECAQLANGIIGDASEGDDPEIIEGSAIDLVRLSIVLQDPHGYDARRLIRGEPFGPLSSVVERSPVEGTVVGSIPAAGANTDKPHGPAPSHEREPPTLWPLTPWF